MLLDLLPRLRGVRIVLASASPRRSELLALLLCGGAAVEVAPSRFDETLDKAAFASAAAYALATARGKADEVIARLGLRSKAGTATPPLLLISCDTVVEAPTGDILEKPLSGADATRMLRLLSGATHRVHSGVVVFAHDATMSALTEFTATTEVDFAELPESLVAAHSASAEDLDKAGGYAIQGRASSFVVGCRGEYSNVVGLPLHALGRALRELLSRDGFGAPR